MALDPVKLADTRGWLTKAAQDLAAAEVLLATEPPLLAAVVFHCQQCAEKALKALLVWYDRPFRKTHNLVEIGEACAAICTSLDSLLRRAAVLTEYAWKFRYPGEPEHPSYEEAQEALTIGRAVYEAILAELPPEAPL